MFLLVEFSYGGIDYYSEDDTLNYKDCILVEAPDNLIKSEFRNFVYENYFSDICNLVNDSTTEDINDIQIDDVYNIGLLQKIISCKK